MRVYCVLANCFSLTNPRFSFVHTFIFHGIEERKGPGNIFQKPYPRFSNKIDAPLLIVRSGSFVPPVFAPGLELIVSDQLKSQLHDFPNIRFIQVEFTHLANIAMPSEGEFHRDWFRPTGTTFQKNPVRRRRDVPAFHRSIGVYWECLMPGEYEFRHRIRKMCTRSVRFDDGGDQWFRETIKEIPTSKRFWLRYPFYLNSGAWLFREDAFSIIEPYLDPTFFRHRYFFVR